MKKYEYFFSFAKQGGYGHRTFILNNKIDKGDHIDKVVEYIESQVKQPIALISFQLLREIDE